MENRSVYGGGSDGRDERELKGERVAELLAPFLLRYLFGPDAQAF